MVDASLMLAALAAAPVDFEKQVRPILELHCIRCHGPSQAAKGLRLHNAARAIHTSGAIVPGKPDESRAFTAARAGIMPPSDAKVSTAEIAVLRQWIVEGAKWPAKVELEALYEATPLTAVNSFTAEIEGPAVDRDGNIYAVSFARKPTIGKVTPAGEASLFLNMPAGSVANGIRFDRRGRMFVADYTQHNVLLVDPRTKAVRVFVHDARMNQPNDLAITARGDLYASDPDWKNGTGQLWFIDRGGRFTRQVATGMGTTNGLDLSPDGARLYVNESVQRKIWVFDIGKNGSLGNKRLLIEFPDFGFDGMRVDVDGNLYATRHGKGVVVKISPEGKVLREIAVLGAKPSNICFGGPDGRTAYVTEMEHGRIVQFRVERPGLEWTRRK